MYLGQLSLSNFRNYRRLDLELPAGASIFWGENAQGKTNLLEAVYLLATTRSPRTTNDAEFVRWDAMEDGIAATRITGRAYRGRVATQIEIALMARGGDDGQLPKAAKRLRVNGIPRRATEMIGNLLAVLFTSQDIDLLTGPPAGRRRYLDLTLSQIDHAYLRALQRYQRVMQQRNMLLRRIGEGRATPEQLASWNEELILQGSAITTARAQAVTELSIGAAQVHRTLSDQREQMSIRYTPQLAEERRGGLPESVEELRQLYRTAIVRRQAKEIAAGVSLVGPHRDDLVFELSGRSAGAYGSRAQQRTVALALRLAEAAFLRERSGEEPVLLLDDILSELDQRRRAAVLDAVLATQQSLITTAELDRFTPAFLAGAAVFDVAAGTLRRVTPTGGTAAGDQGSDAAETAPAVSQSP